MLDTTDRAVLMVSLMCGLPFLLGLFLGWKAAHFSWPVFRWPWSD
jgi:hypothetical protein